MKERPLRPRTDAEIDEIMAAYEKGLDDYFSSWDAWKGPLLFGVLILALGFLMMAVSA